MFNRAARQWHGLSDDAAPDAALDAEQQAKRYDLYTGDGVTLLQAEQIALQRALHDGSVRDAEIVIAPAGQPARRVLCTGTALHRADGTLLGAVVAMTDVVVQGRYRPTNRPSRPLSTPDTPPTREE